MSELAKALGPKGSIIVYNQTFEKTILKESASFLPHYQSWVDWLTDRIVDVMAPFKGFLYYHPDQCGSVSLKKVLPALTGMSYDNFNIPDGQMASLAYMRAAFDDIGEEERQQIRRDLEIYCGQDTEGMIRIVDRLAALCS